MTFFLDSFLITFWIFPHHKHAFCLIRCFFDVVARSCSGCSLEEFSTRISNAGLAAPNPNQLAGLFSLNEMRAARQLEMLATMDSGTGLAETNEVQVATAPEQACKI